jgi:sec-independent protein translocase protein TatA
VPEFLGSWEFIILAVLVLVLFGGKRLPDSARSLGRSLRIFKAETKGLRSDSDTEITATPVTDVPPAASAPGTPPAPAATPEQQRPAQQ